MQKLVETLKTRHQVSRLVSALEPGFIALIKDLNGNHVVQRCLQCLSNEDNKVNIFVFDAFSMYAVGLLKYALFVNTKHVILYPLLPPLNIVKMFLNSF